MECSMIFLCWFCFFGKMVRLHVLDSAKLWFGSHRFFFISPRPQIPLKSVSPRRCVCLSFSCFYQVSGSTFCIMGTCLSSEDSSPTDKKHHKDIETHMKTEEKVDRGTRKLLLLGAGSSGKSTLLKQMKYLYIYNNGYPQDELETYKVLFLCPSLVHCNHVQYPHAEPPAPFFPVGQRTFAGLGHVSLSVWQVWMRMASKVLLLVKALLAFAPSCGMFPFARNPCGSTLGGGKKRMLRGCEPGGVWTK